MQEKELIKKLDAYVKGKLSSAEVDELWVELLKKPEYLSYLDTLTNVKAIIESKAKVSHLVTSKKKPSFWKKYNRQILVAASVLIVIGIVGFLTLHHRNTTIKAIPKISNSEFESVNSYRSADHKLSEIDKMLNRGYQESLNGKNDEALLTYKKLIQKYDTGLTISKAYLNMGIIHYNSDAYHKAINNFNSVIVSTNQNNIIKEKAYWYLGNAFIQVKEFKEAQKAVKKVFDMKGIYRKRSEDLLKKLDEKLDITFKE